MDITSDTSYPTIIKRVRGRRDGQHKWLKENYPETFTEQLHCVKGTPERGYWHHGYMMALTDILKKSPIFPDDLPKVKEEL